MTCYGDLLAIVRFCGGIVVALHAAILTGCRPDGEPSVSALPARIEFNRDIRPILNDNCAVCHGGVKTAGGISFVYRESATGVAESGERPIVPGDPDGSELIRRVTSDDPDYRMPEADHAGPLDPHEIALLRQWIEEGAAWQDHWAFMAPVRPDIPRVSNADWPRNPIDHFVLARLETEGLSPSAEAEKAALLRRASLDLTGLPPTIQELDTFLADETPDAYERQVERLLSSPRFGERWASAWMDLARYADSKGYEKDTERNIWPWRDWVVRAFNANQPYDEFLIDQLAGDLRPNATFDQRIATAFHRNTSANDEGGTDDEEFRIAAVIDRVSTTWTAFSGVTFACVQCHSHPYDPIRHEEFYEFAAFFNNTVDADYHLEYPLLRVPKGSGQQGEIELLDEQLRDSRRALADRNRELVETARWAPAPIAVAASPGDPVAFELSEGEARIPGTVRTGASYDLSTAPANEETRLIAVKVEVVPRDEDRALHTPDRGFIVTEVWLWMVDEDGNETPLRVAHHAHDSEQTRLFSKLKPKQPEPTDDPFERMARRGGFAANPTLHRKRWVAAFLEEPLLLAPGAHLKVRLVHGRQITEKPAPVRRVRLAVAPGGDGGAQTDLAELADSVLHIEALERRIDAVEGTNLPVMAELPVRERRETRIFERGNFLEKIGEPLAPDVPELFPSLPQGSPRNRLGLAEWLVSDEHPLTSRVAVNRFWEQLFGTGIVRTTEDFGSIGEKPSHPDLLDWLAVHFQRDLGWDVKALLREIVTSATYRQTAKTTPEALQRDPENRLMGRGPRLRLTAEMVRDQALLAAGLLSEKIGGPPVMPPQPEGVWSVVYSGAEWVEAEGEDRYRRALYTYMRRSALYPSFVTFDAANRSVCMTRRIATNTPLQALVTLNDPVYHEAAMGLAHQMKACREAGDLDAQIVHGLRAVTSLEPSRETVDTMKHLFNEAKRQYEEDPDLLTSMDIPDPGGAALVAVASAMLNLDETLTR